MSIGIVSFLTPADLAAVALRQPLFFFVVASVIFLGMFVSQRVGSRRHGAAMGTDVVTPPGQYVAERTALGIGAAVVIVVFAAENVIRGYLLNLADTVSWWQYATPVFISLLCVSAVWGLIIFRGTVQSARPVMPASRRTWVSFGSRMGIVCAGVALVALFATSILAGLNSSADSQGRYIHLEIPVPNESIDALRPWFFGWAYGVPVMVCLGLLTIVTWAALRSNAVRPYERPETVGVERTERNDVATSILRVATAGTLLGLAGAFRLIADAGSPSALVVEGNGQSNAYEATWRYAEFAVAAGWLAPLLEVVAFLLLLMVAGRACQARLRDTESRERIDLTPTEESVR